MSMTFSSCGVSFSLHLLLPIDPIRKKDETNIRELDSITPVANTNRTSSFILTTEHCRFMIHSSKLFRVSDFDRTLSSIITYVHKVLVAFSFGTNTCDASRSCACFQFGHLARRLVPFSFLWLPCMFSRGYKTVYVWFIIPPATVS